MTGPVMPNVVNDPYFSPSLWARDKRFISGNTAIAIRVQTSAATPSLLNRLV